jgi:hypothetical protein
MRAEHDTSYQLVWFPTSACARQVLDWYIDASSSPRHGNYALDSGSPASCV